ncbi:MAG: hypothetical protein ABI790_03535, partial [Betaproteobacteria bacterium]
MMFAIQTCRLFRGNGVELPVEAGKQCPHARDSRLIKGNFTREKSAVKDFKYFGMPGRECIEGQVRC